jgi:mannose-6-phosphate isomerase-like protein (cupin superfamily)
VLIRWWRSAINDRKKELPLSIVSRGNVQHYVWGDGCDGWYLVLHSDLSVIEERVPAGASEVRHYHQKAQQFFFILGGQAIMKVGGQLLTLSTGQGLRIPPCTPHRFCNESNEPVRFLVISQPPSHGDRVTE